MPPWNRKEYILANLGNRLLHNCNILIIKQILCNTPPKKPHPIGCGFALLRRIYFLKHGLANLADVVGFAQGVEMERWNAKGF